jgi:nucleoside-triphosphatase THEP1
MKSFIYIQGHQRRSTDGEEPKSKKSKQEKEAELEELIEWEDDVIDIKYWPERIDEPAVNTFIRVTHLDKAGISDIHGSVLRDEKLIFLREPTLEVYQQLSQNIKAFKSNSKTTNGVILTGSPGSGKSLVSWAIAQHFAAYQEKTLLWIHLNESKPVVIMWIAKCNNNANNVNVRCGFKKLEILMNYLEYASKHDVIIIDGLLNCEKHKELYNFVVGYHFNKRFLVFVTSVGNNNVKMHVQMYDRINDMYMHPWEKEQYLNAFNNKLFYETVKVNFNDAKPYIETSYEDRQRLIEEKFFHAGYSARWMFSHNVFEIETIIERLIIQLKKGSQSVVNSVCMNTSEYVSNHLTVKLRHSRHNIRHFTSEQVCLSLLENLNSEYRLDLLFNIAFGFENAIIAGFLFEEEFVVKCVKGEIELINSAKDDEIDKLAFETLVQIPTNLATEITSESFNIDTIADKFKHKSIKTLFKEIESGKWLRSQAYNQGGYDLTRVEKIKNKGLDDNIEIRYILHFYQATIARTHDLKLKYFSEHLSLINKALQHLSKETVYGYSITFVVPKHRTTCLDEKQKFSRSNIKIKGENDELFMYYIGNSNQRWRYSYNTNNGDIQNWQNHVQKNIRVAWFKSSGDSLFGRQTKTFIDRANN